MFEDLTQELLFRQWYDEAAGRLNLDNDPDHPDHFYDYRGAWAAGIEAPKEIGGHWPSEFKREGHPRMVIDGVNTRTGKKVEKEKLK